MHANAKFLSVSETAAYLEVNRATVRRWIHGGRLRGYRIGSTYRISPEELERFVREGGADPSSLAGGQDAAVARTA